MNAFAEKMNGIKVQDRIEGAAVTYHVKDGVVWATMNGELDPMISADTMIAAQAAVANRIARESKAQRDAAWAKIEAKR